MSRRREIFLRVFGVTLAAYLITCLIFLEDCNDYNQKMSSGRDTRISRTSITAYLWGKLRSSLFPNELEKFQQELNDNDPHKLAIAKAKSGNGGLIATRWGAWEGSFGHDEVWGIQCQNGWGRYGHYERWEMASYAPIDWDRVAEFNRMIFSMPDFPVSHLCSIKTLSYAKNHGVHDDNGYFKDKAFLKDLGMTADEYAAEKLATEKSNIYLASYYGHIDAMQKFIGDIYKHDHEGCSPMHYAVLAHNKAAIAFLIEHGAPGDERCHTATAVP